ncbi:Annexin A5 [Nymphaea thermarum]|nr:Annexin A5 [Nymphaea thermarum]
MSTVTVPPTVPTPSEDCEQLRAAFAGWGTNEKLIISILGHRNAAQLKLIQNAYFELYGESLLKDIKKELTKEFEHALLLWTLEPAERDAFLADQTMRKWDPKNHVLIELACARSPKELILVREAYHARFKRSIEEDVAPHVKSGYCKLLVGLVSSYRYQGAEIDNDLAKKESEILHDKIKGNAVNHEEVIRILTTRSKAQLGATFSHYKDSFGNPIDEDLKVDSKDEYVCALKAAIQCLAFPEKYFVDVLSKAIDRRGTDEGALTRVVVTRAEVDMKQIKEEYLKVNGVGLDKAIAHDTSGDYRELLLTLIGHGDA